MIFEEREKKAQLAIDIIGFFSVWGKGMREGTW